MRTKKFKIGMEIILQDLMVFPVVIVFPMVVSTVLRTVLSSGVLPRTVLTTPGSVVCTATMEMWTGTTTTTQSRSEPLFAVSSIDYCGLGLREGRIFFENCLAIVLPIFSITSIIIRLVVKKYSQSIIYLNSIASLILTNGRLLE
jgi:hypothetical protein